MAENYDTDKNKNVEIDKSIKCPSLKLKNSSGQNYLAFSNNVPNVFSKNCKIFFFWPMQTTISQLIIYTKKVLFLL